MSSPSTTARTSWRRAVHQFTVESLSRGRETAIVYAVPGRALAIDRLHEAHAPDELPAEAVILHDLSHLSIEARENAIIVPVDRETGEIMGEPRLRPDVAGEAKALADHLLAEAWSQALKRRIGGAAWTVAE